MEAEKGAKNSILIVDDDIKFCQSLQRSLKDEFIALIATSKEEARKFLWQADMVLLDIRLAENDIENKDGMVLLSEFLEQRPQLPIIMITAYGDIRTAVEAMKMGAFDFLTKPLDIPKLKTTINNALKQAKLIQKVKSLERELFYIEPIEIVGENESFKEIRRLIEYIAKDGYISVLIEGETGTGKELVARLIHKKGWRSEGPFVGVSLASLSQSIIERELFGHERGAFTDAKERKIGYIEQADKGVLFLDDIDATPLEVQAKLLRFLEERCIYRLGSTKPVYVDVQVITASNQPLLQLVQEKKFREDLFFRINTIEIKMPSLREHPEDIPLLCLHFLRIYQKQGRTNVKDIKSDAIEVLKRYKWPGNVRELRNVIERACIMANVKGHEVLELNDLPKEIVEGEEISFYAKYSDSECFNLEKEKAKLELFYIEQALKKANGKKGIAYKILGLNDRFALTRRVKAIKRKYPELVKEFPLISILFDKKDLNNS